MGLGLLAAAVTVGAACSKGEVAEPPPTSTAPVAVTVTVSIPPGEQWPLPDPEVARATLAYLADADSGATAADLHQLAGVMAAPVGAVDDCDSAIASVEDFGDREALVGIIAGVPDEILASVLVDEQAGVSAVLGVCGAGDPEAGAELDEAVDDLAAMEAVVALRLEQIEEAAG